METAIAQMNVYEFVTPSDPITFLAENDKIAFLVAIFLGEGKAGCGRYDEKGEHIRLNAMLMFSSDPEKIIAQELGMDPKKFFDQNKQKIKYSLESFAYGNVEDRGKYDDQLNSITDEAERNKFRKIHVEANCTSMSEWVEYAWRLAKGIK